MMLLSDPSLEECRLTNCAILPLGMLLLTVDLYFDLAWVLFPSPKTDQALRQYYTTILTPRWYPMAYPGYWFPFYAIFKLVVQCPTQINGWLFVFFVPIAARYVGIMDTKVKNNNEKLQHWWTVILLRFALFAVTYWGWRSQPCHLEIQEIATYWQWWWTVPTAISTRLQSS